MTDAKDPKASIRRKVIFTASCRRDHRTLTVWEGPERTEKGLASFDLAAHNMDVHGGTPRFGDEQ